MRGEKFALAERGQTNDYGGLWMLGSTSPLRMTDRWAAGLIVRRRAVVASTPGRIWLAPVVLAALLGAALSSGTGRETSPSPSAGRTTAVAQRGFASLPAAAQASISAALGAELPAYRVRATSGAFAATSSPQRLASRFSRSGVGLRSGALELQLSLSGVGGVAAASLGGVMPVVEANRVTYVCPGVSEWYVNGPLGLEQGFSVPRPLSDGTAGPLTLSMRLSGNGQASLARDARSITIQHGSSSLRYGELSAKDAGGRPLRSWLVLRHGGLLVEVDARGARYPLTIDPLIQQGNKLTGDGEVGEARFGVSAALSADGGTALIGGPRDDEGGGAAWVFERSGSAWVQQGEKLTSGEAAGEAGEDECAEEAGEEAGECSFGQSVALSADGNTALIGDPSATARHGTAWVFTRSGSTWTRGATLSGGHEGFEGRFGKSVALSADGDTALIGDPSAENQHGMAWVFSRSGSEWTLHAALADAERSPYAHVGRSVALSADGDTALLGGPGDAGNVGAAWVFTQTGSTWSEQAGKLTGVSESESGHFGKSVALSADGGTALVGGPTDAGGRGAVWAFSRTGSSFTQQGAKLVGGEAGGEPHFGTSVALSGDGNAALVGAPRDEGGFGTVTQYVRAGSTWNALPEQLAGSQSIGRGWAGTSAALSVDGHVALVGAMRDNGRLGAAWVFADEPLASAPAPAVTNVTPGSGPTAGGTEVTIKGTNLTGVEKAKVLFGSIPATGVKVISAIMIKAVAPAAPEGTVHVTVGAPAGTSSSSPADTFTFMSGAKNVKSPRGSSTGGSPGGAVASGGVLGFTGSTSAGCTISLSRKRLVVQRFRVVLLRLLRTGTGGCKGRITLRYKVRGKGGRVQLRTIGAAGFSLSPGKSRVVKLTLNRAGRTLFSAHRGRLNASLALVRVTPQPTLGRTASVRLSVKKIPTLGAVRR
jgi:hypothetical protein